LIRLNRYVTNNSAATLFLPCKSRNTRHIQPSSGRFTAALELYFRPLQPGCRRSAMPLQGDGGVFDDMLGMRERH
jgi:hypothetical protein